MLKTIFGDSHAFQRQIVVGAVFGLSVGFSAAYNHLDSTKLTILITIAAGVGAWVAGGKAKIEQ